MPGVELRAENLRFSYGGQRVIDGVTLTVAPGDRLALVGPNGSGKSTLIRLLSGVLRPEEGRVLLEGRDLRSYRPRELARRIAVVPQETSLDFPFSVLEVTLMGRSPHLVGLGFEGDRDVAIAERCLELVGARSLGSRRFQELSGGEKQRVVIARALAQEPAVLLLDEPATFLDVKHVVDIFEVLVERSVSERISLVVVLHDLNLAALYCPRIALLKNGRLLAEGPTGEVLTYANVRATFETDVYVSRNDLTGTLNVLPLARRRFERRGEPAGTKEAGE
jgi:iron complex transport system ATP-binding protein